MTGRTSASERALTLSPVCPFDRWQLAHLLSTIPIGNKDGSETDGSNRSIASAGPELEQGEYVARQEVMKFSALLVTQLQVWNFCNDELISPLRLGQLEPVERPRDPRGG